MSEFTDQMTRELLALTSNAADVRRMLVESWEVGYDAGRDDEAYGERGGGPRPDAVNPFRSADN